MQYFIGRALEALGREKEAKEAYEKSISGVEHLSGDRDSWNSENFYMVLSLKRLGREQQAEELMKQFEHFAESQMDSRRTRYQSEARYLLGLVKKQRGQPEEAKHLMEEALKLEPDLLGPRFELRGDVIDPLSRQREASLR
jgi:tetratricopeptide (TPR) repeat protein